MAYTQDEWNTALGSYIQILIDAKSDLPGYFATTAYPVGGDVSDSATQVALTEGQISDLQTAFESRIQIVIDGLTAGFVP